MGNFGPVGAQNYTSLYSAIQSKKFFQNHQMDNFDTFVAQNYASLYLRICCKVSFKLCNIIGHSKQIRFTQVKSKKLSFYLKSCRFLESTVPLINAYYKKTSANTTCMSFNVTTTYLVYKHFSELLAFIFLN